MRHARKINHLGRTDTHRKAMLSNMASSLILHKRITTTVAKAKALRTYVEPLITRSKEDTTHSRRTVFSYLQDKNAVSELFRDISAKVANRPGGYTRILRTGFRQGDAAEMCIIELVDYNENMLATKETKKAATRRSRRGGGKKGGMVAAAPASEKLGVHAPKEVVKDDIVEDATIVEEIEAVEEVAAIEEVNTVDENAVEVADEVEEMKSEEAEAPETTPADEETKE